MATKLSLINRALTEIAARQPITDYLSAEGVTADQLYQPAIETLLRESDPEFARTSTILAPVVTNVFLNYTYAYAYPADCVRVRQIVPEVIDDNDPYAVVWDVGTANISAVQTRVIYTNEGPNARMTYTTNLVTESEFDSLFQERLVRYLGSMLAMPVGGRPDFSRTMLEQAGGLGAAGRDRDS